MYTSESGCARSTAAVKHYYLSWYGKCGMHGGLIDCFGAFQSLYFELDICLVVVSFISNRTQQ